MANQNRFERHDKTVSSQADPVEPGPAPLAGPGYRPKSPRLSLARLTRSRYGNWFINALILLASTVLLLALCEGLLRWLDGYELLSPGLDAGPAYQQPANGTGK